MNWEDVFKARLRDATTHMRRHQAVLARCRIHAVSQGEAVRVVLSEANADERWRAWLTYGLEEDRHLRESGLVSLAWGPTLLMTRGITSEELAQVNEELGHALAFVLEARNLSVVEHGLVTDLGGHVVASSLVVTPSELVKRFMKKRQPILEEVHA